MLVAGAFLALAWGRGAAWVVSVVWLIAALFFLFAGEKKTGKRWEWIKLSADIAGFLGAVLTMSHPGFWILAWMWITYLLASALLVQDWREILLIMAVCGAASWGKHTVAGEWNWAMCLLLGLVSLAAVWQRNQMEQRIERLSRQGVLYRAEAQASREAERERIANDFHDGPLQSFISLQMGLQVVQRQMRKNPEVGLKELENLQELYKTQVSELRDFIQSIRIEKMAPADLTFSVRSLVDRFERETGIASGVTGTAELDGAQETAVQLLQIVREALANVRKHAAATAVAVSLDSADAFLNIRIEDNGRGYPFEGTFSLDELDRQQLGPASIRRRVRLLDGELELESMPGQGTSLRIRVPR